MKKLLIWGAGGLGREALDIARAGGSSSYSDISFIDDTPNIALGTQINDAPLIGNSGFLREIDPTDFEICIAVGKPALRRKLAEVASQSGHSFATLIDPTATVRESAVIEAGAIVGAKVFVSCNARIGAQVLLNVGCVVGHDVIIGAYAVISPAALILGNVTLGEGVEVGSGASIFPGTTVGGWSRIAMGSGVYKPVDENVTVSGNPSRAISKQEPRWYEESAPQNNA